MHWVALAVIMWTVAASTSMRADDQACCRELLDKSFTAIGDEDRLAKLAMGTWKTKGKIVINDKLVDGPVVPVVGVGGFKFRVDMDVTVQGRIAKIAFVFSGARSRAAASADGSACQRTDIDRDAPCE